ncbi:unnamed protein product [Ectocarpus sp. CCAP 1310/34]|nr:unnamed protein product [Ectocarpus sp. CCAP 1310/34]
MPAAHSTSRHPLQGSFIKELEAKGVGRPSTYASIIGTLRTRTYENLQGRSLTQSLTGFVVADLLWGHLPDFTDIGFTAKECLQGSTSRLVASEGWGATRGGEGDHSSSEVGGGGGSSHNRRSSGDGGGVDGDSTGGSGYGEGGPGGDVVVAAVGVRGVGGSGGSRRGFGPW